MSEILCSWIGDTDWLVQEGNPRKEDDKGPILRTLENKDWANRISEIHLLNNYENRKANRKSADFKKWLAKKTDAKIVCESVDLISPTNFTEIDQVATALVRSSSRREPCLSVFPRDLRDAVRMDSAFP